MQEGRNHSWEHFQLFHLGDHSSTDAFIFGRSQKGQDRGLGGRRQENAKLELGEHLQLHLKHQHLHLIQDLFSNTESCALCLQPLSQLSRAISEAFSA